MEKLDQFDSASRFCVAFIGCQVCKHSQQLTAIVLAFSMVPNRELKRLHKRGFLRQSVSLLFAVLELKRWVGEWAGNREGGSLSGESTAKKNSGHREEYCIFLMLSLVFWEFSRGIHFCAKTRKFRK